MAETPVVTSKKQAILLKLAEGWSLTHASTTAGVSVRWILDQRKRDPEFDEAVKEAIEMGTDTMEDQALQRAVYGIDKPIYQQGMMVGTVREYSDGLMQFLLKARRPEKYRERSSVEMSGAGDKPVNISFNIDGAANLNSDPQLASPETPAVEEEDSEPVSPMPLFDRNFKED